MIGIEITPCCKRIYEIKMTSSTMGYNKKDEESQKKKLQCIYREAENHKIQL